MCYAFIYADSRSFVYMPLNKDYTYLFVWNYWREYNAANCAGLPYVYIRKRLK